jgi:hypothetical protein
VDRRDRKPPQVIWRGRCGRVGDGKLECRIVDTGLIHRLDAGSLREPTQPFVVFEMATEDALGTQCWTGASEKAQEPLLIQALVDSVGIATELATLLAEGGRGTWLSPHAEERLRAILERRPVRTLEEILATDYGAKINETAPHLVPLAGDDEVSRG